MAGIDITLTNTRDGTVTEIVVHSDLLVRLANILNSKDGHPELDDTNRDTFSRGLEGQPTTPEERERLEESLDPVPARSRASGGGTP